MFFNKTALLAATLLAGVSTSAYAQAQLPAASNDGDASLHAAGASAVQNFVVRTGNCVGVDNQLATTGAPAGALRTISTGVYVGAPAFNCATNTVQSNFSLKYTSTGSGFGRRMWYMFKDNFAGSPVTGASNVFNPFPAASGTARWDHLQMAFSEAPMTPTELALYNNGGTDSTFGTFTSARAEAGAAVQIPLYVLPVAVAYFPTYGTNASGNPMTFNATSIAKINNVSAASIKLTRELYCGIFNGDIKNWNDSRFAAQNGGKTLQDLTNDTTARWSTDGVPVRLVGRLDQSGTTDIFTRHLAAVCTGITATANKYLKNAESLPYNASSGLNFRTVRGDSNYSPAGNANNNAGTTNLIGNNYWVSATQTIGAITGGATSQPTGNQGSGLFLVADGNGQVANAIKAAPDYVLNGVTLNGKVGYVSADFVAPSPEAAGVAYAQLQIGTSTKFAPPSAAEAVKAFGSGATALLPPQTNTKGAFTTVDNRIVRGPNTPAGVATTETATRANPMAWTDVLYVPTAGNTLAAPLAGYPMVGTSQFLGYTCYKPANRAHVVQFLGMTTAGLSKTETNATFAKTLFTNTKATEPGILVQSNVAALPTAWQKAIQETFLKNSTQVSNGVKLGDLNLWMQNKFLLTANSPNDLSSNPTCNTLTGAQGA